eukprot:scaffold133586_cov14-Tisochrysis_lutea.AAC.1
MHAAAQTVRANHQPANGPSGLGRLTVGSMLSEVVEAMARPIPESLVMQQNMDVAGLASSGGQE